MKISIHLLFALSFVAQPFPTIAAEGAVAAEATDDVEAGTTEEAVAGEQKDDFVEKFRTTLSGATLVGSYTQDDQPVDKPPAKERYTIKRVTKVPGKDDIWRFDVRIQFGKYDVTLPLNLEVQWAGDTPMITLTDYRIPALGTFSARVLFHGDRYAGTWQHGKVGGHLFGRIERAAAEDKPADADGAAETPASKSDE